MSEDYPDLLTRKQTQELLHMEKNRILDHYPIRTTSRHNP